MNRHTDVATVPHREPAPPLPVIDWTSIGREAPERVPVSYTGKEAPLPKADVIVMTWTTNEWSALDHVFLNSDTDRHASTRSFEKGWFAYSKDAPALPDDGSAYPPPPLWGYYQLVKIKNSAGTDQTVLLFKANAHLAHPLWIQTLEQMVARIIDEVQPDRLYSIGTAGGTSPDENLGDAAITNSAHITLKNENNIGVDYNNQTFVSTWYPSLDLVPAVETNLLFRLSNVVNNGELQYMISQLHDKNPGARVLGLDDLLNPPLLPSNLRSPRGLSKQGVPLLTTDYYFIAKGDDSVQYCVLEMDDAVIAKVAGDKNTRYCFVRNVSDPVVPDTAKDGSEIPFDVRKDWSGIIYLNFGIYSSFNGALLTWATIAGDAG